jgi:MFS transporter
MTLWRHRDFLLLWGGQAVSQAGSQVTVLALPLVAMVVLHATTFQVGLLSAAVTSAYLLFALPAGLLADRVSKRRLMLWCDVGGCLVIGSVPAGQAAGVLTLGQLYLVAVGSGAVSLLFLVAHTSYLPALIDPDQLTDGNGKLAMTQSAAQVAGPGLGAVLVGLFGAALAMTSDALSYAVSACCLLSIRGQEPTAVRADQEQPHRIGSARVSWLSMTFFTLPGLLIPLARPGWRVALFAVGGMSWTFGSTLCTIALTSYQQATCPARLRGRVSAAARWITWGTLPLGGLAGGALGAALGVQATLWGAVIGGCSSGLWLCLSPLRRMRDLPAGRLPQPA